MRPIASLFLVTFLNTFIVVYSFRALAEDDWAGVLVTDLIYGVLGFTLFKKLQAAETRGEMLAYTSGVASGSQAALWLYQTLVLCP